MEYSESGTNKIDNIQNKRGKGLNKKLIETITTVLLSAATVLSAWCIYESSQWNGEQYFRIEDENNADRKRMETEISANQRQAGEAQLFLQFIDAITNDNKAKEEFLLKRFPPHLKKATLAWKAMDPVNNLDAPLSPMLMNEYVLPEVADIKMYTEKAKKFKKAANECDNRSDNYMLLSLVLSTVLFFCGLIGVTDSRSNKLILLGFASFIFVLTLCFVVKFPVLI